MQMDSRLELAPSGQSRNCNFFNFLVGLNPKSWIGYDKSHPQVLSLAHGRSTCFHVELLHRVALKQIID